MAMAWQPVVTPERSSSNISNPSNIANPSNISNLSNISKEALAGQGEAERMAARVQLALTRGVCGEGCCSAGDGGHVVGGNCFVIVGVVVDVK